MSKSGSLASDGRREARPGSTPRAMETAWEISTLIFPSDSGLSLASSGLMISKAASALGGSAGLAAEGGFAGFLVLFAGMCTPLAATAAQELLRPEAVVWRRR